MIFICHSSVDKPFVSKLVARLVEERVHTWLDATEIKVGDSLFEKIEDGLSKMDFLAIVLTRNSVNSQWCKEELKIALTKQIKERRTVVLPLLVEKCDIPIFLQEKKYADFTRSFDEGLSDLMEVLNRAIDLSSTSVQSEDFKTDIAWDYGLVEFEGLEAVFMSIDAVSFSKHLEFSVLCQMEVVGNERLTCRFKQYMEAGLAEIGASMILGMIAESVRGNGNFFMIDGGGKQEVNATFADDRIGVSAEMSIEARQLGKSAEQVIYHWGPTLALAFDAIRSNAEKLDSEDTKRLLSVLRSPIV